MNPSSSVFMEPLDVLFLRGNKLFGAPGSYGESLVPPWPSVAAGALRSRMLVDDGVDPAAFARGEIVHPVLGTPDAPGTFAVTAFHLARRFADGRVEPLLAPPADLVVSQDPGGTPRVRALRPTSVGSVSSSAPCTRLPVLAETTRRKPVGGYWLAEAGWRKYLAGGLPATDDLLPAHALWTIDPRVGVGLDADTGSAAEGQLFSVQAVAMTQRTRSGKDGYDVGFLTTVRGTALPRDGTLRLGGDGRAAALHAVTVTLPEPDVSAICQARRCRMVLTTPGLFELGWLPTGCTRGADGRHHFDFAGVSGRLVCAAVPRHETVSGWDLARGRPKPAQRAAPAGSVYWLDELDTTPEALRKLVETGLWHEPCDDAARRAEGYNRIAIAAY